MDTWIYKQKRSSIHTSPDTSPPTWEHRTTNKQRSITNRTTTHSATVAAMGKRTLDLVANSPSWQSADRVLPADDDYTSSTTAAAGAASSPTGAGKTTKGVGGEGPVAVVGSAVSSPVPSGTYCILSVYMLRQK